MIRLYTKHFEDMWFGVALDEKRVYATSFALTQDKTLSSLKESIPSNVSFERLPTLSEHAARVLSELKDIYDGKEESVGFVFAWETVSKYARKVMKVVCLIPVGYVSSYGLVAEAAGGSPRAVGRVMATNPFAPICPCHRVVSSDYTLGGYGGGLGLKLEFLKREKRGFNSEKEIPTNGRKLKVFPVEFVLEKLAGSELTGLRKR